VKAPWYEASWMPMLTRNLSALLIAALLIFGIGRPLLKARAARKAAEPASDGKALSNGANAGAGRAAPAGGAVTLDMIENAPGYAARAELIRNFVKQDPARAALVVSDLIKADTQSESRNG
jgi:flagellar M-ring protein FliF